MAKKKQSGKELAFYLLQIFATFFWLTLLILIQEVSELKVVLVLAIILQILAIVFLVLSLWEKKAMKAAEKASEQAHNEKVMELARREFEKVDLNIDEAKLTALLEPQRVNIQALQKKYDKPNFGVALPGPLVIITLAIVAVQEWHKGKIYDKLTLAKRDFYNDYRRCITNPLLDACFPGYKYYPAQGITSEELVKLNVFSLGFFDKVTSEDYVEGTYKNIHYHQSDLIAQSRSSKSTITFFRGRVGIYEYAKSGFTGQVIISAKDYGSRINNGGLNKVEMESMEFNKTFDVYADTPHTAYFVLTPHFMEHIMNLNAQGDLYVRIVEGNICILRNHVTGMFEPDLTKPLDIKFEIGRSHYELKEIERFIDVLNIEGMPKEPKVTVAYSKPANDTKQSPDSLGDTAAIAANEPETTLEPPKFKLKKM